MKLDPAGDPLALPPVERLSARPEIVKFARLFTAAECAYLIGIAQSSFRPSTVISQGREMLDPVRSSHGATLHWLIEDPAVHALNRRVAAASATAVEQGEAAQILRYRPGQEYRPHFDFVPGAANQRIMTALVWLNHDFTGGETHFLRTDMKLRGRKGDAFVFRNVLPDGSRDPASEHAGRPVTSGTKHIYSRWIRERRWQP
jgi:prolyl 4-hydroxylase